MRNILILFALFGLLLSMGCQADVLDTVSPEVSPTSQPDTTAQGIATPDRIDPSMTKMPERVPPTEPITPVTGEVPAEFLESIVKDLAQRTGVAPANVTVIQDQEIVWNDGSLGCPKPGEFYTQALVNGYWVILEVDGARYDYRVAASGYFFICERGIPPGPPATPSS